MCGGLFLRGRGRGVRRTIVVSYGVMNVRGQWGSTGKECGGSEHLEIAVGASLDECWCLGVFTIGGPCRDSRQATR